MWVKTGRKSIPARNAVYLIPSKPLPVVTSEQLQGATCPLPALPCHQSCENKIEYLISTAGAEAVPGLGLKASANQSGSCSTYWPFVEHIPTLGNTKQGSKSSGKKTGANQSQSSPTGSGLTSECGERSDVESWQESTGAQTFRQQGSGPFLVTRLRGVSN